LSGRNRFFKAESLYISKDINPKGKEDFIIANKPADIHAIGILTKQTSYADVVKMCINWLKNLEKLILYIIFLHLLIKFLNFIKKKIKIIFTLLF